jgi:UrcA family protein
MNKVNTFGTGTRQFAVGVVAAMSLCLAAHAAHAEEAAPQRVVAYADLNIHTPDGAATLYRRRSRCADRRTRWI